jgi:hypothetical protein
VYFDLININLIIKQFQTKAMKLIISTMLFILTCISCTKTNDNCAPNCNSSQCTSNTQAGVRCQNMTKNCCGRCYLHI